MASGWRSSRWRMSWPGHCGRCVACLALPIVPILPAVAVCWWLCHLASLHCRRSLLSGGPCVAPSRPARRVAFLLGCCVEVCRLALFSNTMSGMLSFCFARMTDPVCCQCVFMHWSHDTWLRDVLGVVTTYTVQIFSALLLAMSEIAMLLTTFFIFCWFARSDEWWWIDVWTSAV